jgi:hypothetical protein
METRRRSHKPVADLHPAVTWVLTAQSTGNIDDRFQIPPSASDHPRLISRRLNAIDQPSRWRCSTPDWRLGLRRPLAQFARRDPSPGTLPGSVDNRAAGGCLFGLNCTTISKLAVGRRGRRRSVGTLDEVENHPIAHVHVPVSEARHRIMGEVCGRCQRERTPDDGYRDSCYREADCPVRGPA